MLDILFLVKKKKKRRKKTFQRRLWYRDVASTKAAVKNDVGLKSSLNKKSLLKLYGGRIIQSLGKVESKMAVKPREILCHQFSRHQFFQKRARKAFCYRKGGESGIEENVELSVLRAALVILL